MKVTAKIGMFQTFQATYLNHKLNTTILTVIFW